MPAKARWYGRLGQVIAELEALPCPAVDRATLQFLLGVGARRAQQIMSECATERIGSSSLADRDLLVAHLRRLAAGDAGHYERQRRHRLASTLEQLRRAWLDQPHVFLEAPATIVNQEFADLPDGIAVEAGCITVRFADPQEALQKLYALAMAIGNDRAAFEHMTGKKPAPGAAG
jgi:hypothetical protein